MKKIVLISLIGFLGGCVSTDNPAQSWTTYYEKADAPAKQMRFTKIVHPSNQQEKQFDTVGSFSTGKQDINIFRYDQVKTFSLINLDTDTPITTLNQNAFKQLNTAKAIRFYEFGMGLIEIADYRSENAVCQDFFSPKGITVDFTTNYHNPNYYGFIVSFTQAHLSAKKGIEIRNTSVANHLSELNQKPMQQFEQNKQRIIEADAQKLGRFLFTVVCKNTTKM